MIVLFGALLNLCLCAQEIVELTDSTFYPFIKNNEFVFVDFYGAGCGNCKAFYPDFVKLSEMIEQKGRPFLLGKLEVNTEQEVADKLIAGTLPQIMLFVKGEMIPYTQDRSANNMFNYLEKEYRKLHLVTVLDSVKKIDRQSRIRELQVFLLSDDPADIALILKLAEKYSNYNFYRTSKKLGLEGFEEPNTKLVLTKPWEETILYYKNRIEERELSNFLEKNERPLVMEFSEKPIGKYNPLSMLKPSGIIGVLLFKSEAMPLKVNKEFMMASNLHRTSNMIFVSTDLQDPVGQRVSKLLKVTEKDLPAVYIIENRGKLIYTRCEGEIMTYNIKKCIDNHMAQQIKIDL